MIPRVPENGQMIPEGQGRGSYFGHNDDGRSSSNEGSRMESRVNGPRDRRGGWD